LPRSVRYPGVFDGKRSFDARSPVSTCAVLTARKSTRTSGLDAMTARVEQSCDDPRSVVRASCVRRSGDGDRVRVASRLSCQPPRDLDAAPVAARDFRSEVARSRRSVSRCSGLTCEFRALPHLPCESHHRSKRAPISVIANASAAQPRHSTKSGSSSARNRHELPHDSHVASYSFICSDGTDRVRQVSSCVRVDCPRSDPTRLGKASRRSSGSDVSCRTDRHRTAEQPGRGSWVRGPWANRPGCFVPCPIGQRALTVRAFAEALGRAPIARPGAVMRTPDRQSWRAGPFSPGVVDEFADRAEGRGCRVVGTAREIGLLVRHRCDDP
jgi:hypothetical protein